MVLKIKERWVNKLKKGFNATLLSQFDQIEGCLSMNNNHQWGGLSNLAVDPNMSCFM